MILVGLKNRHTEEYEFYRVKKDNFIDAISYIESKKPNEDYELMKLTLIEDPNILKNIEEL